MALTSVEHQAVQQETKRRRREWWRRFREALRHRRGPAPDRRHSRPYQERAEHIGFKTPSKEQTP